MVLIDRGRVMADYLKILGRKDSYKAKCEALCKAVDESPAVDAVPVVHARWKRCFEDWRQQIEGDECSWCGHKHYGMSINQYHYCPNCGAKMDGGAEG